MEYKSSDQVSHMTPSEANEFNTRQRILDTESNIDIIKNLKNRNTRKESKKGLSGKNYKK